MKVQVEIHDNQVSVLIDAMPHVILRQDELTGVQAYIYGGFTRTFHIDFMMKTKTMNCSYDSKAKWHAILKALKQQNLFKGELL